jgi:antitoxin HicB
VRIEELFGEPLLSFTDATSKLTRVRAAHASVIAGELAAICACATHDACKNAAANIVFLIIHPLACCTARPAVLFRPIWNRSTLICTVRRAMKKKHIGSSFDDWLREEGIYEETTAVAIKRVLARQIGEQMVKRRLTKAEMARRMDTSRAALDRLLDPENDAVTLHTLSKAAAAVGRQLHFTLS